MAYNGASVITAAAKTMVEIIHILIKEVREGFGRSFRMSSPRLFFLSTSLQRLEELHSLETEIKNFWLFEDILTALITNPAFVDFVEPVNARALFSYTSKVQSEFTSRVVCCVMLYLFLFRFFAFFLSQNRI